MKGKNAVVTGAAQGIGLAIAKRLAEAGATIILTDLQEEAVIKAARELTKATGVKAIDGDENFPKGHPQLAQPALQQAKNLAKNLALEKSRWKTFSYFGKGSLAIIGRNIAMMDFPGQKGNITGFTTWFIWIFVHIMGLINFKNRLHTFINWIGYYIYKDQDFRMIFKPSEPKKEEKHVKLN